MTQEKRIEIYKEALEIIKKGESKYGMSVRAMGLCILLPCIWKNLNHYSDDFIDDNGKRFRYQDTCKYFTEFAEYYESDIIRYDPSPEWRIKALKAIIKDCEKNV